MHLKTRDVAYTGLMIALGVVLLVFGGYLSTATLFFLAASAFLAGIMERNHSPGLGVLYLVGTAVLGALLSPRKLHAATFAAMGIYVLAAEWFENRAGKEGKLVRPLAVWACKFFLFHLLLVLALVLFEQLLGLDTVFAGGIFGKLSGQLRILPYVAVICLAELIWLVFDRAYLFFRRTYGHIFVWRE